MLTIETTPSLNETEKNKKVAIEALYKQKESLSDEI